MMLQSIHRLLPLKLTAGVPEESRFRPFEARKRSGCPALDGSVNWGGVLFQKARKLGPDRGPQPHPLWMAAYVCSVFTYLATRVSPAVLLKLCADRDL
jgi:hypothetical protein